MNTNKINLLLRINELFMENFGRMIDVNADPNDLAIKLHHGHPSHNYIVARDSSYAASQANNSSRVIDLEKEGTFGIDLNDPKLHTLLKLLQAYGRKVDLVNMTTY